MINETVQHVNETVQRHNDESQRRRRKLQRQEQRSASETTENQSAWSLLNNNYIIKEFIGANCIAGQFQTEQKVEEILEQENPQIFVENVHF